MNATHVVGIPEIDAQHEVVFAQIKFLREILSDKGRADLIHPALLRLHELLVAHFENEESFMNEHRRMHKDMLDLLEQCLTSASTALETDPLEQLANDKRTGPNDSFGRPMGDNIKRLLDDLSTHEVRNPSMTWGLSEKDNAFSIVRHRQSS